jgi:ABC-type uncharacterized transport system ATPase subunit
MHGNAKRKPRNGLSQISGRNPPPARTLSGGNQQKIVVAREIGRNPRVLVAFQPTWGLDPGATRFVIDQVLALRQAGGAILYISAELDEVLAHAAQPRCGGT